MNRGIVAGMDVSATILLAGTPDPAKTCWWPSAITKLASSHSIPCAGASFLIQCSWEQETKQMFIAMNRFRVKKGSEDAFEKVWLGRDSYLDSVPGFLEFHLLKGPEEEDYTLYSSHTVWQSKRAFEEWTKSKQFRASHARAGNESTGPLYLEHPKFEGFEVRQTIARKATA